MLDPAGAHVPRKLGFGGSIYFLLLFAPADRNLKSAKSFSQHKTETKIDPTHLKQPPPPPRPSWPLSARRRCRSCGCHPSGSPSRGRAPPRLARRKCPVRTITAGTLWKNATQMPAIAMIARLTGQLGGQVATAELTMEAMLLAASISAHPRCGPTG